MFNEFIHFIYFEGFPKTKKILFKSLNFSLSKTIKYYGQHNLN